LIAHDRLIKFFTETGLLAQTTTVMVRGQPMRTTDYLSEHAEKLAVAMSLKQLPNEYDLLLMVTNSKTCEQVTARCHRVSIEVTTTTRPWYQT